MICTEFPRWQGGSLKSWDSLQNELVEYMIVLSYLLLPVEDQEPSGRGKVEVRVTSNKNSKPLDQSAPAAIMVNNLLTKSKGSKIVVLIDSLQNR